MEHNSIRDQKFWSVKKFKANEVGSLRTVIVTYVRTVNCDVDAVFCCEKKIVVTHLKYWLIYSGLIF